MKSDFDTLLTEYHSKLIRFCTVMHNFERRLRIIDNYPLSFREHEKIIEDTKEGYYQLKSELDNHIEQFKSIKREGPVLARPSNYMWLKQIVFILDGHLLLATKTLAEIERTARTLKIPEQLEEGLIWEPPSNGHWKITIIAFLLGLLTGYLLYR